MKKLSGKGRGYVALVITSILWGTTWVASKIGINEMPALQMASIRQFIAGACFVIFFMSYKKLPLPNAKQFRWLIIMAFLMFVFANGLSTWSLKYIPTGFSSLIGALYPLSVVIIEMIFFKSKKMNALTLTGFILGIAGVGIVFYENAFHNMSISFLIGVSLSLVAMLSWSLGSVFIARNKAGLNPYYATGWQMLLSSVVLFIMAKSTGQAIPIQQMSFKAWMAILYLVVFGSIISFVAFIFSMKKLPVAIASLYAYINPLVAMLFAALLLHESLTMNILWGAIVTLTGVFLVNYNIRRNEKIIVEAEI